MFALEYKEPYIVKEPMLKNCTCQSYRWKQMAICEEKEPLEEILKTKQRPTDWRIVPLAF